MGPHQICQPNRYRQATRLLVAATVLLLGSACQPPGGELARAPGGLTSLGLPLDVTQAGDTLLAVGEHGRMGISEDDGESWRYVQSSSAELLTAVNFSDEQHGYAVGHALTILKTVDGGQSWESYEHQDIATEPLFDVLAIDEELAIAVGAYGNIWRTENGGQNWSRIDLENQQEGYLVELMGSGEVPLSESHYYGLTCVPDQHTCTRLIVVGEGGAMLQSYDHGESWEVLETDADITFFGVISDGNDLLAYGMFGQAMRSSDGGDTWHRVQTGTQQTLLSATWLGGGPALLVGYDGINRYVERGANSARVSAGYSRRDLITTVHNLGDGRVLLGGSMGLSSMALENNEQ